jgi:hypothetical protein
VYVGIMTMDGAIVVGLVSRDFVSIPPMRSGASATVTFAIESLPLLPGEYQLEIHLVDVVGFKFEVVPRTFAFTIVETPVYGGRKIDRWYGNVAVRASVALDRRTAEIAGARS